MKSRKLVVMRFVGHRKTRPSISTYRPKHFPVKVKAQRRPSLTAVFLERWKELVTVIHIGY